AGDDESLVVAQHVRREPRATRTGPDKDEHGVEIFDVDDTVAVLESHPFDVLQFRAGPDPDARSPFDLFDQIPGHAVAERVAPYDNLHVLRIARQIHRCLAGGIPATDDHDALIGEH